MSDIKGLYNQYKEWTPTELVLEAQKDNEEALIELLYRFGWRENSSWQMFLGKYIKTLWYGRLDFKKKESRRFIQLYIRNQKYRRKLFLPYVSAATVYHTMKRVNHIQNFVRANYTLEELKQDLIMLFLILVRRYKPVGRATFEAYIYNVYRYEVYRHFEVTIFNYDVYNFKDFIDEEIEVEYIEDFETTIDDRFIHTQDLSIDWIYGNTGPLYQDLTWFERTILKEYYLFDYSVAKIAKDHGSYYPKVYETLMDLNDLIRKRAYYLQRSEKTTRELLNEIKKESPGE